MNKENHIATAQDFKLAQELERKTERVVLPKLGKAVLMQRPSPRWFLYHGWFPATLAVSLTGESAGSTALEELRKTAMAIADLLREVMVEPRVSLSPGPGEISADLISDEDLTFIVKWAVGAVASDGSDLSSFRDERAASSAGPRG